MKAPKRPRCQHLFTTHEVRRNPAGKVVYDKWLCSRCGANKR